MLASRPHTVGECDELLVKIRQARTECCGTDRALLCAYDDQIVEVEACRAALLVPDQRGG